MKESIGKLTLGTPSEPTPAELAALSSVALKKYQRTGIYTPDAEVADEVIMDDLHALEALVIQAEEYVRLNYLS